MTDAELRDARGSRLPGRRRLRRPVHRQHDGDGLRVPRPLARSAAPACRRLTRRQGRTSRASAGALVMDLLRARRQAARHPHARSRSRTRSPASSPRGGSTNAVLHLLAIAREAGVALELDDFDRISDATPLIADLKPGGRFVATDLHARRRQPAGRASGCVEAGLLHGDAATVTGRTIGEEAAAAVETPGQEVVRPIGRSDQADRRPGHPARQPRARGLRASRSPGTRAHDAPRPGAGVRQRGSGVRRRPAAGRSRPATSSSSATKGRAAARACARCWPSPARSWAPGLGESVALLTDGRFSGRDARPDGRPRRARSVARRADRRRPRRRHHHLRRREARAAARGRRRGDRRRGCRRGRRRSRATRPACSRSTRKLVSSASTGAITG